MALRKVQLAGHREGDEFGAGLEAYNQNRFIEAYQTPILTEGPCFLH
jgi:hypothetical protein